MGAAEDHQRLLRLVNLLSDQDLPDAIEYLEWLIAERTPTMSGRQHDRRLREEEPGPEYRGLHPEMQSKLLRLLREAQAAGGDLDEAPAWLWLRVENDPKLRTLREEMERILDGGSPA
jgi:hypothetical protein